MTREIELLERIAHDTSGLPELVRRVDLVEVRLEQVEEEIDELPERVTVLEIEHRERSERGSCGPGAQVQVARIGYRQAIILGLVALVSSIVTAVITAVAT